MITNEQRVTAFMRSQRNACISETGNEPNTQDWIETFESDYYNQVYAIPYGISLGDMINYFLQKGE